MDNFQRAEQHFKAVRKRDRAGGQRHKRGGNHQENEAETVMNGLPQAFSGYTDKPDMKEFCSLGEKKVEKKRQDQNKTQRLKPFHHDAERNF